MALEERVSRLEGAYEQVDGRLSDLSASMDSLRSDMSSLRREINDLRVETPGEITNLRAEMNTRFDQVDRRFNTLYVIMAGGWVTIIGAIVGLALTG